MSVKCRLLVASFDAQGCASLTPLSSSWGERLLTFAQSAAVVFLIMHYRSRTVKGIWTRFQRYILNDAKIFKSGFCLLFFSDFAVLSPSTQWSSRFLINKKSNSFPMLCCIATLWCTVFLTDVSSKDHIENNKLLKVFYSMKDLGCHVSVYVLLHWFLCRTVAPLGLQRCHVSSGLLCCCSSHLIAARFQFGCVNCQQGSNWTCPTSTSATALCQAVNIIRWIDFLYRVSRLELTTWMATRASSQVCLCYCRGRGLWASPLWPCR